MTASPRRRSDERGFTLIEALAALALTGLVLSALANITAQWLPNWNRGIDRIQRSEVLGIALQRIGADLSAAEYVSADRGSHLPLFDGSELSVMFVRTALGPNAGPGLDVVRVGETTDVGELVTMRSQTSFRPLPPGSTLSEQIHLGSPMVLLRRPYRLSFAYAGADRIWKATWHESDRLPALIRLTVRDAMSERILSVSTVTPIHVQAPSDCVLPDDTCDGKRDATPNPQDQHRTDAAPAGRAGAP